MKTAKRKCTCYCS